VAQYFGWVVIVSTIYIPKIGTKTPTRPNAAFGGATCSGSFDPNLYRKWAPDLAKDAFYRWLDKYFLLLQLPVALGLYAVGGWSFVIYGVFLRAVILWHTTWLINSASHITGYRSFEETGDNSRNLWWTALLTYGEGWHNNHHAHPNVAPAGRTWWEIDTTWWVIQGLQKLGLAKKVVMPPQG
jgi:sn-2 palmitoyl-lipid 9-desaturase